MPTSREDLKAQIRAVGMPGTATLNTVISIEPVDDRRLFRMDLVVRLDNGASYVEQDEPVPIDQEHAQRRPPAPAYPSGSPLSTASPSPSSSGSAYLTEAPAAAHRRDGIDEPASDT